MPEPSESATITQVHDGDGGYCVMDSHGVVHEAQCVSYPTLARDNNVDYNDIDVTLCDYECSEEWPRVDGPVTCLKCIAWPEA